MQAKSQRGFSNKKLSKNRPNSSIPLNPKKTKELAKSRPSTAKIPNTSSNQHEKTQFQLKINPLNSNNNFRATRPTSSATDRVFNKYWENKTPSATNFQTVSKFDYQVPKGESLITNELLVDLNKKQKSIYNRSLYKYNKIDWETKKNGNFLSTVGGLEIKSNTCILNTPILSYDNFSINSTAIASRPQSNTIFNNTNHNNFLKERPLTGFPIKSKKTLLRLNSGKSENEDKNYLNNQNMLQDVDDYANTFQNGNNNANHLGIKRPLTGNINKRTNAMRPMSATSNKLLIDAYDKENICKVANILSEEMDEPINEIVNESLSLDLSSEKMLDSASFNKYKSNNLKNNQNQNIKNSAGVGNFKNSETQRKNSHLNSPNKHNTNFLHKSNTKANQNSNFNNFNSNENFDNNTSRIKSTYYPKVEALFKNFEKIDVKAYSIKLQVADSDLLDLFDRSQRTKAATLAKVGDYEYYTPCQRIGSFMDFSQTLRWKDLKNIEKHYIYTKNQLGFLQSKHNIITLVEKNFLKNSSEHFRDPNSLFHGFLKDEYLLDKYYKDLNESNETKTYDPYEFLPKTFFTFLNNSSLWSENFCKLVQTSMNNYNKYFISDKIVLNDLEPFNEDVQKKILSKVDFKLYEKRKTLIKSSLEDIKQNYYFTLKTVIMKYILRSPYERKRLNIQYFPRQTPPSSITIANHGSFNRNLYKNWVKNYGSATENMEKNLFAYDITSTSILEWTECFKHVNLVYLKNIRNLSYLGNGEINSDIKNSSNYNNFNNNFLLKDFGNVMNNHNYCINYNNNNGKSQTTMHLAHFKEIQLTYAMKNFYFLRDIYYRGVILILKKNKFFKMKIEGEGKWTFKGYLKKPSPININKKKNVNFKFNSDNNTSLNNNNNLKNLYNNENKANNNFNSPSNINNSENHNIFNSVLSPVLSPTSKLIQSIISSPNKIQNTLYNNTNNNIIINNSSNNKNPSQISKNLPLNFENELYGMEIFDKIEDFWSNLFIDNFPDIRLTHSYYLFLANSNKKNIDLTKFIYDEYDDLSKLKLNNSTTTFITLFFRQLIEKSVEELVNFILSYKLVDELVTNMNQQFLNNNPNYNFEQFAKPNLKDNNHLQVIKHLKESSMHGGSSNNSSNVNIININNAPPLNLNNLNLNLNTINEVEKLEKSFKETEEYLSGSNSEQFKNFNLHSNKSQNSKIQNSNLRHFNNNNYLISPNNNSSLNQNNINQNININHNPNQNTNEPISIIKRPTSKPHFRESSREVTIKSCDTGRTKDYNYINLNNHLLFPHYDLNNFIYYKEQDIKLPLIKAFVVSDILNPVMHVCIKIDNVYNVVKIEYSYDKVSEIFIKICDNIIGLFNGLYTTHFLDFKTLLPSEVERVNKAHWLRINEVFADKLDTSYKDYYTNVSPNLIIDTEKFGENNVQAPQDEMNEIYNFFTSQIRNNYLKPALISEDIFVNYRNVIAKSIKDHILEMEEVLKLYEPIKDLINQSFPELVYHFKENFGTIPEYNKFSFFIDKIRIYMRYVNTIPDFVYYSMFAVDTRESKGELLKKLNELMNILMREMENLIIQIYDESIQNYNRLYDLIHKRVTTPDELVEMEATKTAMNLELLNIGKNLDDANKIHFFLLSADNLFSDNLIHKTDEMKRRFNKFRRDYEEMDRLHQKDREFLENKFREDRKQLEADLQKYYDSINSLDLDIHINTYESILEKITNLENIINPFKNRIDNNLKDEEKLFSFKLNTFEEFDRLLIKLEKYSIFWQKAFSFYEIKKPVILCFSEELDFLSIINQFNEIEKVVSANKAKAKKDEETLIKMSKILEDDLEITREFILLSYNIFMVDNLDDNLRTKIIEMLDNKKLEQSCRLIIENVLKIRNYSLV